MTQDPASYIGSYTLVIDSNSDMLPVPLEVFGIAQSGSSTLLRCIIGRWARVLILPCEFQVQINNGAIKRLPYKNI